MKYTDAEKLKAEIEKDTPEKSENPINHEWLKEEINRTYHDGSVTDTSDLDHNSYENIARHFYEIGCRRTAEKYDEIEYNRQRAEESVQNVLEEAARKSAIAPFNFDIDEEHLYEYPYLPIAEQKFIEGAKWQEEQDQETIELAEEHAYLAGSVNEREQMMKEAVEGEVVSTSDNGWECIRIYKKLHKCDDKVKLIIVKED